MTNDKLNFVRSCPEFLYAYNPEQRPGTMRYAFKDRVAGSLDKAYAYAVELHEAKLVEAVKQMFRDEYGYSVAKEVRDISPVFGPLVIQRNYRITLEAIDGVESVSDYLVTFDEDWQVTTCDEYNRIM